MAEDFEVKEFEGGVRKAMVRFWGEGSDGATASEMMRILAEVIGEQPTEGNEEGINL